MEAAEAHLPLAHLRVDSGQLLQGGIALCLPLNILGGDGFQGDVGYGISILVDHIGTAVLADLDGGDDVVQEGLRRDEVHHACDKPAVGVDGRGHHDRQLPGDFADQGLGDIDVPLHGLLDVFPVGIVLPVKNADTVQADQIAPLEAVEADALVNNGLLFLHRGEGIGQLGNAPRIHRHIFIGNQLFLNALRRQDGRLSHHLVHRGNRASVIQPDAGAPYYEQRDQDGRYQAYRNLFPDTIHLSTPIFCPDSSGSNLHGSIIGGGKPFCQCFPLIFIP